MGQRENSFREFLLNKYGEGFFMKPKLKDFLTSDYHDEILFIYKIMNGQLKQYPTRFRGYDISCQDFIIELDEERHFNRYRISTFKAPSYGKNNNFSCENYQKYCRIYELNCLKSASWSRNWETDKSKVQFWESDEEGCLLNNDSSRWKQRAFYDYLRDVSSLILRISIWDEVDGVKANQLIKNNQFEIIDKLIEKRLN